MNMIESLKKGGLCKGDGDCEVGKEYDLYDIDNTNNPCLKVLSPQGIGTRVGALRNDECLRHDPRLGMRMLE
jgi:hypothetical protein